MDPLLSEFIDSDTPPLNPDLANGIAVKHMTQTEEYVDSVFRSAARGLPEGMTYEGCRRCTPEEEFNEVTKKRHRGNKRTFDIAPSQLYMMQYFLSFQGKPLPPRYLLLPYAKDAGMITIGGSSFVVSAVATDRVISKGVSSIFVRLLRDRLTFERAPHQFRADNKREIVQVAYSMIYHKTAKMKKIRPQINANCTLVHYLFCKYGFTETFERFANCRPVVGTTDITPEKYPESDWVICSSTQVKPKGCGRTHWEPSYIRVAVKRDEYNNMVRSMLAGFFYVVDHFPQRVMVDYVDNPRMWKIILGLILFSSSIGEGKLHDDINDHIQSLDEYVDPYIIAKMKELPDLKKEITDIYQLFAVVIENFNDWLLEGSDKINSVYGKEYSVLYYLLFEITYAIFLLHFRLKAAAKKGLNEKEVNSALNRTLKTGLIYSITRLHGEISTVSNSGDNKAFKITSLLVPQSGSNKSARKDRTSMNDPSKHLHVSVAEICGYSYLPKSAPDGRSRLNLHSMTDSKSVVVRNPKFVKLLDDIQEKIRR